MVRIVLSLSAKIDLKEIVDYIKRDSIKYARLEKNKILTVIEKLVYQPLLGKPFARFQDDNIRVIVYKKYLIIYEIRSPNLIEILTIHHHARSFSRNSAISDDE